MYIETISLAWKVQAKDKLISKTRHYNDQERENIQFDFLIKSIDLIGEKTQGHKKIDELKSKVELTIYSLPEKLETEKKLNYGNARFLDKIEDLKNFIKAEFKYRDEKSIGTNANFYGLMIGIALGPLFGVLIGNISLGICFGLPIGLFIIKPMMKKHLLQKAINEGNLL